MAQVGDPVVTLYTLNWFTSITLRIRVHLILFAQRYLANKCKHRIKSNMSTPTPLVFQKSAPETMRDA